MRITPVYNIGLLSFIKSHGGLTFNEISKSEDFKHYSSDMLESELKVLAQIHLISINEDMKYI